MNYIKNRALIATFAAIAIIISGYVLLKKSSTKDDSTFIVGTAAGYAPFVSINKSGEYEGFDIDVANALAQKMGKKLIIKDLGSMTSLFTALNQGSIDAIIWGLSITQDRLKKVDMIAYQGEPTLSYSLIFWNRIPDDIKTIEDLKNKTIAVEPASSQDVFLGKYALINRKPIERVDDALLEIQYGKSDAALVEPVIAKKFKAKFSEINILDVPLSPEDQVLGVGITIKKGNTDLKNKINSAVTELKNSAIIKEYEQKWGMS